MLRFLFGTILLVSDVSATFTQPANSSTPTRIILMNILFIKYFICLRFIKMNIMELFMVSLSAFLRLTRFEHAIMFAIAVLIGEIIAGGSIPLISFVILRSLLVPIFSEMGSFALNDYLDGGIGQDKQKRRSPAR